MLGQPQHPPRPQLAEFAAENNDWLRIYQMSAYAPELNPAEGIWSLLKRAIANFAAPALDHLVRIVKRKLKKILYRPQLITGCLAATGLTGDEADLADFVEATEPGPDPANGHITRWTWKPVPEPKLTSLSPRGQAWEITRYQAYQAQLAGHTIAETFTRAAAFLKQAAAEAPALPDG